MKENKQTPVDTQEPLKTYELADLMLTCHSCGNQEVIIPNVKGGVGFKLFAMDEKDKPDHIATKLSLGCSKCKAVMTMSFREVVKTGVVDQDGEEIIHRKETEKVEEVECPGDGCEGCEGCRCKEGDEVPAETTQSEAEEIENNDEEPVQEENKEEPTA